MRSTNALVVLAGQQRIISCNAVEYVAEPDMDVRYFVDPETGDPHIYEHGVSETEVEYVLKHAGEDRPGSDVSRHALGQTAAGRYLRVIYVPDPGADSVFVVTAYELRGKPLQTYRRRRRRRGRR